MRLALGQLFEKEGVNWRVAENLHTAMNSKVCAKRFLPRYYKCIFSALNKITSRAVKKVIMGNFCLIFFPFSKPNQVFSFHFLSLSWVFLPLCIQISADR
jgi:hypothetical protein